MDRPPAPAAKRRLPMLQNSEVDEDERPRWHWLPIGAAFGLSIWLPLAMLATSLARMVASRIVPHAALQDTLEHLGRARAWERGLLTVVLFTLPLLGFALALFAAGVLVGRFGARVEARDAAWSGVIAAFVGAALTVASSGLGAAAAGLIILVPDGALAGYVGGLLGVRLRRKNQTRRPPPVAR